MNARCLFVAAFLAAVFAAARPVSAQQVIFLVRHAERAATPAPAGGGMMADDPPLTPAGEQRATKLASMLASAGVRHIYTSEFRRTQQTAQPLADRLHVTPEKIAANDPDPLVAKVKAAQGNVLVVGHSNTVPDVLKKLGIAETVTIGDGDFDNLFIVVRAANGKATLVKLKY